MGKLRLAGPPTFRRQFAASLAATMVFSIACTACVWTFSFWLLSREILFRPANYYERSSAQIVSFAQAHSDKVLSLDFRSTLEGVIPLEGIDYQVLDASANLIYGSIDEPMLAPEQLWSAINTQAESRGESSSTVRSETRAATSEGSWSSSTTCHCPAPIQAVSEPPGPSWRSTWQRRFSSFSSLHSSLQGGLAVDLNPPLPYWSKRQTEFAIMT